jgi:peroxiredoxin family protein
VTDTAGRERLSLIVFSGDYDRLHYAFVMASAAAATNRPVTMFFTMGAIRALLTPRSDSSPGWAALTPADNGQSPEERDAAHAKAGIATLEELIGACAELDVTMRVCEMGLIAEGLSSSDFRNDLAIAEGGMVSFLAEAEQDGGRIVFI